LMARPVKRCVGQLQMPQFLFVAYSRQLFLVKLLHLG
jgi:hypothetical protein